MQVLPLQPLKYMHKMKLDVSAPEEMYFLDPISDSEWLKSSLLRRDENLLHKLTTIADHS